MQCLDSPFHPLILALGELASGMFLGYEGEGAREKGIPCFD